MLPRRSPNPSTPTGHPRRSGRRSRSQIAASALTAARARPGTYSIVARDPATGQLGVAVQSHWFSVGPIVPWARAGVGAVATQANVEITYGPRGLELMADGLDAGTALRQLVSEDPLSVSRQVAFLDASGAVAAHTGTQCLAFAGDCQGQSVSCQANIMASPEVWPAMLNAYEGHAGTLTDRLMAALSAAEQAGGDLRGRQSAAIVVVPPAGRSWDTVISLRVEDHPQPLVELARLIRLDRAYKLAGRGDEAVAAGDHQRAAVLYEQACELAPESDELRFWAGIGAATVGDVETAVAEVRAAIRIHAGWRELLGRLPPQVAPAARAVLERLERTD